MSSVIQDPLGNDVEVFAEVTSAYTRQTMRFNNPTRWEQAAKGQGWLIQDEEGEWVAAPGVDFYMLPAVWKVKPTYDENGDVVTPGIPDNREHVNLYLREPFLSITTDEYENWKQLLIDWMSHPGGNPNKSEVSKNWLGNELIDTPTINSVDNVWQTP